MRTATCHPDRLHNAKGLCKQCYDKFRRPPDVNRATNALPEVKARKQQWVAQKRSENPRFFADRHRLKRYGLTSSAAWDLMYQQGGKCKICLRSLEDRLFHIDHDHITGTLRGILCAACNTAIGMLQESEFVLHRALAYLRYHGSLKYLAPHGLESLVNFADLPPRRKAALAPSSPSPEV